MDLDTLDEELAVITICVQKENTALKILENGIICEEDNISKIKECLKQIDEAFELIRNVHKTVSLEEFKRLKKDIKLTEEELKARIVNLNKLKGAKKTKERELEVLERKLGALKKQKSFDKVFHINKKTIF